MINYNQYSRSSILSCYMTMVSHWDIFIVAFFVAYMARLSIFKIILFFCRKNHLFIEILFNYFFNFFFLLKNFLQFINRIFSSVAFIGYTIFVIILTYYFVTITACLTLLISNSLFSVFFFYWYSYTLKIGINNK